KQKYTVPYQKNGSTRYINTVIRGIGTDAGRSLPAGWAKILGNCTAAAASTAPDATSCATSASRPRSRTKRNASAPTRKAAGTRHCSLFTVRTPQVSHSTDRIMNSSTQSKRYGHGNKSKYQPTASPAVAAAI